MSDLIIKADHISFEIPYGEEVLKDIDFELSAGEFLGVLGVNGAGKTALINLLLGNIEIKKGELSILGENPYELEREFKHEICYISQNIELHKGMRVSEFLKLYKQFYPKYCDTTEQYLIKRMEIDQTKNIGGLSLGQRKKVQVVAALSTYSKLLIVDEITAVFDEASRQEFFLILDEFKKEHDLSILLATNIAKDLAVYADSVLLVKDGRSKIYQEIDVEKIFSLKEVA